MRVEACCKALLRHLLPAVDPHRQGICFDVGIGTFAFFCEGFARLGYRTVAVEPLPVRRLRRCCERHQIELIESCLSDQNGMRKIYSGQIVGLHNHNFNSLAPDWFGSSTKTREVSVVDLPSLIDRVGAAEITCLKLDIEGWELKVIQQLPDLSPSQRPKVLMFEFGGGAIRKKKTAGWSDKYLGTTLQCLDTLSRCGYGFTLAVEFAPVTGPEPFDLQTAELSPEVLFHPLCAYGNLISLRGVDIPPGQVAEICRPYRWGATRRHLASWLLR